jgi:hypothetical protein
MYYSMHLLRYDVIMHILPVSNSPNGEFCIHFLITRCRRFFVMHVNPGRVRLEESPRWCSLAQGKHTSGHSQNLLLFCKKKFLSKPEPQLELFFLKNFRFTNFFFSPHFLALSELRVSPSRSETFKECTVTLVHGSPPGAFRVRPQLT